MSLGRIFLLMCLSFASTFANAQVAWDSFYAENVQVCLKQEKVVVQVSLGNSNTGSYLEAKLPNGFDFAGFNAAASSNTNGSITYGGEFLGWHRFNLTFNNSNPSVVKAVFGQFATCGAGISSFTTQDSFRFYNTINTVSRAGLVFNGSSPDLSITGVVNSPSPVGVGGTLTRSFNVTNGGFGATSNFLIADKYITGEVSFVPGTFVINPAGVNFTIPANQILIGVDTVKINLTASQIQQIGDGDTLFENSENFELQYDLVPNICGVGNVVTSELLATWKCNNFSSCNRFSVSSGASISIPGTPSLSRLASKPRQVQCFNNSRQEDTILITNNGSGSAVNVSLSLYTTGYPNTYSNSYMGSIDTANLKYSIGINGVDVKPAIIVTGTKNNGYNSWGCSDEGLPGRVSIVIPELKVGDTLYIKNSMLYCQFNRPCNSNPGSGTSIRIAGLSYDFTYQNACENVSFTGGTRISVQPYQVPRLYSANYASATAVDGISYDFEQKLTDANPEFGLQFTNRSSTELTITLPSVLVLDSVFPHRVYFEASNGTLVFPYQQTGPYTFKFRNYINLRSGKLHIKVKGYCDPVTLPCPALYNWGFNWKVNPDTTSCNYFNSVICKEFQVAWLSTCRPLCCPEGLQALEYSSNRVNYGLPDNDDNKLPDATGSIDLSKVRTDQMIPGDTIEYYFKGVYNTSAAHPSWPYSKLIFDVSNNTYWTLICDSVTVKRVLLGDTSFAISPVVVGNRFYHTDISFLPDFQQGDTVIVKMKLRNERNTDWSFVNQWDGWASDVAAQPAAPANLVNVWRCTPIGDALLGWRRIAGIDRTRNTTLSSEGCNQMIDRTYWYSETGFLGRGQSDKFEFEYRPGSFPAFYAQYIPNGYSVDSVKLEYMVNHSTTGLYSSNTPYNGDLIPFTLIDDTLKYNLNQFYLPGGGTLVPTDEGFSGYTRIYITPSCKVINNSAERVPAQMLVEEMSKPFNTYHKYPNGFNTQATYRNHQPEFITNSPIPIAPAYEKVVSWEVAHNNVTNILANNSWVYFISGSGNISVDSIQIAGLTAAADSNGFYQLGDIAGGSTVNFKIFSTQSACNFDSLTVYFGYGCQGYPLLLTDSTCSSAPIGLYVQPQPASIQTQIRALSATPLDPSNPAAGDYGSNTVMMCESFPMEMEIQSSQTGTSYNIEIKGDLPLNNGNVGLDYVPDSGYIEYPIGTVPRKFGWRADSAILANISNGHLLLPLNLIDSVNFDSLRGLKGTTVTNNLRIVRLRFKLKPNCNLIAGNSLKFEAKSNKACQQEATAVTSFLTPYELVYPGFSKPYIVNIALEDSLITCMPSVNKISFVKVGSSLTQPTDSIIISMPLDIGFDSLQCADGNCISGTINYSKSIALGRRVVKFPFPAGLNSGDSAIYSFVFYNYYKSGCVSNAAVKVDVLQKFATSCKGNPCPNSFISLGNEEKIYHVTKPDIAFSDFGITYRYPVDTPYHYYFWGEIENNSQLETDSIKLQIFKDVNLNNVYDPTIDSFVYELPLDYLSGNGNLDFSDSFESNVMKPSPSNALFAVIDTGFDKKHCFCKENIVSSIFNVLNASTTILSVAPNSKGASLIWGNPELKEACNYQIWKAVGNGTFMQIFQSEYDPFANETSFIDSLIERSMPLIYYQIRWVNPTTNQIIYRTNIAEFNLKTTQIISAIPNPSNGKFRIRGAPVLSDCNVFNVQGNKVYSFELKRDGYLDLRGKVSPGVYYLKINNTTLKIMILNS